MRRAFLAYVLTCAGCWVSYAIPADTDGGSSSTSTFEDEDDEPCGDPSEQRCAEVCVDVLADVDHCGGCDIVCEDDELCEQGDCVPECDCDPVFEVCVAGECDCRPGLISCGDACVAPLTDTHNCGDCGNDCEDERCLGGECSPSCEDFDECDDECTVVDADPLNCGECGHRCESDELCVFGNCRYFEAIDPDECDACPCEEPCEDVEEGLICCFSVALEEIACIDTPLCP